MLCCGWKPFCGHKNNRKKRRMGRKPCASFLGYQNFQPRTAVSGANFELVPFEAPSIGRMPLGNPCWTLRAFLRLAFRSVTSGLLPIFAAIPILDALHAFTVWLSVWHMSWTTARFRLPTFSGLRILVAACPFQGTVSALYRFMVSSTLDAARSPSTVAMASPKLPLRGIRLSPLPEPSESLSGLFPRFPYSLP